MRGKTNKYAFAIFADLIIITIILFYGLQFGSTLSSHIISPLQGVLRPLLFKGNKHNIFVFVPGSVPQRFDIIDPQSNMTLAYYDIPVLDDGTFYQDSDGYQTFQSDRAISLFERAHEAGAKVLLTLTQTDSVATQVFLNDSSAQEETIKEAIQAVEDVKADGIALDFEFTPQNAVLYKEKYNQFVKRFTDAMHRNIKDSQVAVALPDIATDTEYDIQSLAQNSDKIFMMAYSFAVPELKDNTIIAPDYGDTSASYLKKVALAQANFLSLIQGGKFALETAWYGNGHNYPLHLSDAQAARNRSLPTQNTLRLPLSQVTTDSLVNAVPGGSRMAARKNLPYIAQALQQENILNPNVLAYALATIEHETAGTFEPIEEFSGRKSARRLGYEGGTDYFGRGFIQLTHLRNYKKVGERIGMGEALVKNPDLALRPDVSAKILAAFFRDNGIAYLATQGDFVDARTPINPDQNAYWIASLAWKYLEGIV